jgi:hypothetical protein
VKASATAPYGILTLSILGLLPVALIVSAFGAQVFWISLTVELKRLLDGSRQSPYPPDCQAEVRLPICR